MFCPAGNHMHIFVIIKYTNVKLVSKSFLLNKSNLEILKLKVVIGCTFLNINLYSINVFFH